MDAKLRINLKIDFKFKLSYSCSLGYYFTPAKCIVFTIVFIQHSTYAHLTQTKQENILNKNGNFTENLSLHSFTCAFRGVLKYPNGFLKL